MRHLSIKQPWAELLVAGVKAIEIRTWRPSRKRVGELVAIHASKTWDDDAPKFVSYPGDAYFYARNSYHRRGGVIGVARLTGVVQYDLREQFETDADLHHNPLEWWNPKLWGFEFADAVRFAEVIPCRGALGFSRLPDDVAAAVYGRARGDVSCIT